MAAQSPLKRVNYTRNTMGALHVSAVGLFSGGLNNLPNIQVLSANTMEIVSSLSKIDDDARSVDMNDAWEQVSILQSVI